MPCDTTTRDRSGGDGPQSPAEREDEVMLSAGLLTAAVSGPREDSRFPHVCYCGAPAYVGAYDVECTANCGGRRR